MYADIHSSAEVTTIFLNVEKISWSLGHRIGSQQSIKTQGDCLHLKDITGVARPP